MDEYIKVVNKIASGLQGFLSNNPGHPEFSRRESELKAIREILTYVEEQLSRNQPVDSDLGDLSDIPQDLLAELHLIGPSELEQRIIAIVDSSENKKANINTILVALFRRHGVTIKRRNIQNKLSRMMGSDLILGVDGEKGVYTTVKPDDAFTVDDKNPLGDASKLIDEETGSITIPSSPTMPF